MATALKIKKLKAVTRPLFKWVNGQERFYRIDSAMFIGKEIKHEAAGAKKKEPAHLCFVTNLETGEEGQIILGKVLQEILNENYPDNSYVGKCFSLTQNKVDGKDYNVYVVTEVEVEVEDAPAEAAPATVDTAPAEDGLAAQDGLPTVSPELLAETVEPAQDEVVQYASGKKRK